MKSQDEARVEQAMDDMELGEFRRAYTVLGRLLRWPEHKILERAHGVPEAPKTVQAVELPPIGRGVVKPTPPQTEAPPSEDVATPLAQWKAEHPTCLIIGCDEPADCHHIWSLGTGGPDCDWNRSPLGRRHHDEWHRLEPEPDAFIEKYAKLIPPEWHGRIAAARAAQLTTRKGTNTFHAKRQKRQRRAAK